MAHDVDKAVKTYWIIFAALLVLTGVTVWAADWPTGATLGIVVALAIASLKVSLVGGFFMHLFSEKKVIFWLLVLTFALFIPLMLLPAFWAADGINIE